MVKLRASNVYVENLEHSHFSDAKANISMCRQGSETMALRMFGHEHDGVSLPSMLDMHTYPVR